LSSGTADIYSISVSDKFGSAGITGACFVRQVNKEVVAIEGFMLSCRILRRDIEYAFLGYLLGKLKTLGIKRVDAEFCLTDRNKVAKSFLPVLGFQCTSDDKGVKKYKVNLENNNLPAYQYIGIRENEID
jgi:predicted enzyme involved in methoxymalonyl-ACP biosynthesis